MTVTVGVDQHVIADTLVAHIARIRRAGRRYSGRPVELSLLTGAQLEFVRLLRRRPGISVADAAQELGLAANTISTLVRQLTDVGLLVRRLDPSDRRIARLELSRRIASKVEAWRDRRVVALADAIGELAPEEQERLAEAVALLARVADRLERAGQE